MRNIVNAQFRAGRLMTVHNKKRNN